MRRLPSTLVLAILTLFGVSSEAVSTETLQGAIRGAITDSSDGALPGVTVVATSTEGRVLAATVTDGAGAYEIAALPAGELRLTFQLDGFATAVESVAVRPGTVSTIGTRLDLAPVTETVVVVGKAPVVAPRFLPPPPPVLKPVPVHDRDSICGPSKPGAISESFGTIRARRREMARELYTKDDELIIDGGTLDGLEVGQNMVVRRRFRIDAADAAVMG